MLVCHPNHLTIICYKYNTNVHTIKMYFIHTSFSYINTAVMAAIWLKPYWNTKGIYNITIYIYIYCRCYYSVQQPLSQYSATTGVNQKKKNLTNYKICQNYNNYSSLTHFEGMYIEQAKTSFTIMKVCTQFYVANCIFRINLFTEFWQKHED